jgi:hypothetical protein
MKGFLPLLLLLSMTMPVMAAPDDGDVNKALDDVLSKPIETLIKEAPQPTRPQLDDILPRESNTPSNNAQRDELLKGQAQMDAGGAGAEAGQLIPGLKPLLPKNAAPVLKGEASLGTMRGVASQEDPDVGNDQLRLEWDAWRNRFLRAVQMQIQASVNYPDPEDFGRRRFDRFGMPMPRFPLGTEAWFDCEVTNDGRIARIAITQPSGFPAYDRAVIEGVRALEGTSLLRFPPRSRRQSVRQEAGIKTATTANYQYYNFGDVEQYSVPGRRGGGY